MIAIAQMAERKSGVAAREFRLVIVQINLSGVDAFGAKARRLRAVTHTGEVRARFHVPAQGLAFPGQPAGRRHVLKLRTRARFAGAGNTFVNLSLGTDGEARFNALGCALAARFNGHRELRDIQPLVAPDQMHDDLVLPHRQLGTVQLSTEVRRIDGFGLFRQVKRADADGNLSFSGCRRSRKTYFENVVALEVLASKSGLLNGEICRHCRLRACR